MQSLSIKDWIIAVLLGLTLGDYTDNFWIVLVISVVSFGILCLIDTRTKKKSSHCD